jgi:hypothetical protein
MHKDTAAPTTSWSCRRMSLSLGSFGDFKDFLSRNRKVPDFRIRLKFGLPIYVPTIGALREAGRLGSQPMRSTVFSIS